MEKRPPKQPEPEKPSRFHVLVTHIKHPGEKSSEPAKPNPMLTDMLAIAEKVMGPQEKELGVARWGVLAKGIGSNVLAVSGTKGSFVYENSAIPNKPPGLKRVRLSEDGKILSIATQAIRSAQ